VHQDHNEAKPGKRGTKASQGSYTSVDGGGSK
jgi:hypothetical protein